MEMHMRCAGSVKELQSERAMGVEDEQEWICGQLLARGAIVAFNRPIVDSCGIDQAIEAWRLVIPDSPFSVAKAGQKANIQVELVHEIPDCHEAQGEVESDEGLDDSGLVTARITVRDNVNGRPLTDREIGAVITHELGHLLGLDDSPDGRGIMGEFDPQRLVTVPTSEEAQAVEIFRGELRRNLIVAG
jgi:hypothetical protein